jgi:endogenous inhibitor of DNA gyrase (YacG/DUF329 family)
MTCFCPYCGKEIGRDIEEAWFKGYLASGVCSHRFEYECSECGKVLGVLLAQKPHFYSYKRDLPSYFGESLNESPK